MNNTDFRRIFVDADQPIAVPPSTKTPTSLSSSRRQSVALMPRSVRGVGSADFVTQGAHRNASFPPHKKIRSSVAPKGSKIAAGYTDRVLDRNAEVSARTSDDREQRLRALEEQLKLGQIEREVFEKLRDEITGGDITTTHLVKGLDRKLLERVRAGEDVLNYGLSEAGREHQASFLNSPVVTTEEELERYERQAIAPQEHQQIVKKGEVVPPLPAPPLPSGVKRSRAAILADLKASRKLVTQPIPKYHMDSRFKKIGEKESIPRVQLDPNGREILIAVDADGRVKRKVKKQTALSRDQELPATLPSPQSFAKPLGIFVPETKGPENVDDVDEDIFENVGSTYDPLGDMDATGDPSSDEDAQSQPRSQPSEPFENVSKLGDVLLSDGIVCRENAQASHSVGAGSSAADSIGPRSSSKLNYFGTSLEARDDQQLNTGPLLDPTIMAAIKRAAALHPDPSSSLSLDKEGHDGHTKLSLNSASRDRDLEDLDLGFGSSRFDDDEDESITKHSEGLRRGASQQGGEGGSLRGARKRKRNRNKHGANKESAADILNVINRRKTGTT